MLQRLGRSATRLAAPARAHWEALAAREYAGQPLQAEHQSSLQQEVCRHSDVVMPAYVPHVAASFVSAVHRAPSGVHAVRCGPLP